MPRLISFFLLLLTFCGLTNMPPIAVNAQTPPAHHIYLPLVRTPAPDLSGQWLGYLIQPGKSFAFSLDLQQSGSSIQGSSQAETDDFYAVWSLEGSIDGAQLSLTELDILEAEEPPGWRWCIKDMQLQFAVDMGVPTLTGTWAESGCNAGELYLQAATGPFPTMQGMWEGTISQGDTNYTMQLEVDQDTAFVWGDALITRGNDTGVLAFSGYVAGSHVQLEDQFVRETTGLNWCLKTMVLRYKGNTLTGFWTAPGCLPGTLSLTKRMKLP